MPTNGRNGSSGGQFGSGRPSAAEVARIDGNVTHVLVSNNDADGLRVFVNSQPVLTGQIDNVGVNIVAPTDDAPDGTITGILSLYETPTEGSGGASAPTARQQRTTALFPGTVEVVARGRRIVVSCSDPGSFDGLWLGLGLRNDGTSTELTGVRSLRIVVSPTLLDARLIWAEDGVEEDLLPE